jgi:hypothetical protein
VVPQLSQGFPLKSDRLILEAIFEHGYNVPWKTSLEEIQPTTYSWYYSACFSRREESPAKPLLTVYSINSAIA